jgi:hypothetical protein
MAGFALCAGGNNAKVGASNIALARLLSTLDFQKSCTGPALDPLRKFDARARFGRVNT